LTGYPSRHHRPACRWRRSGLALWLRPWKEEWSEIWHQTTSSQNIRRLGFALGWIRNFSSSQHRTSRQMWRSTQILPTRSSLSFRFMVNPIRNFFTSFRKVWYTLPRFWRNSKSTLQNCVQYSYISLHANRTGNTELNDRNEFQFYVKQDFTPRRISRKSQ
jgi:hypothetical protein